MDEPAGPLPPLTDQDYLAVKRMLAELEAIEAEYREKSGRSGFEAADCEALRVVDESMAVVRAAAEGYEATHRA